MLLLVGETLSFGLLFFQKTKKGRALRDDTTRDRGGAQVKRELSQAKG